MSAAKPDNVVRLDPEKADREASKAERRERERRRREMDSRVAMLGRLEYLAGREKALLGVLGPAIRGAVMGHAIDRAAVIEAERFAASLRLYAEGYECEVAALRAAAAKQGEW